MSNILQKMRIEVGTEFDFVTLTVDNSKMKMSYRTAFLLSSWLRQRGKEAKRFAGDTSSIYTVTGTLEDAEEAYKKGLGGFQT
jgi:hypothetical protein